MIQQSATETSHRPRVLYVSGDPASRAHEHLEQLLALQSVCIQTSLANLKDIQQAAPEAADIVVLFRVPWSSSVSRFVARCRASGTAVGFFIDDLVFDPSLMTPDICDYMRILDDQMRRAWIARVEGYARTFSESDFALVVTETLAEKARKLGKETHVLNYCGNEQMIEAADAALQKLSTKPSDADGILRVGYASGTPTHQRDFSVVAPVLGELLKSRPKMVLTIVGNLNLEEFPEMLPSSQQIETRPTVPYMDLFHEYARFDVNIVPLQCGNPFCESKTAMKYYEAALVGVPTVSAATQPYQTAARQGVTGFCAQTRDEWRTALAFLLDHPAERVRIGRKARLDALSQIRSKKHAETALRAFRSILNA
ncbi:MAG: glycosyltransferase [Gammaproteobacteria bacterium]|nr:glycosyltransferase [Gammaproteobacteria bacterium]